MTIAFPGPTLEVDRECPDLGEAGVNVQGLGMDGLERLDQWMTSGRSLSPLLCVHVVCADASGDLPGVAGRYELTLDGVRFTPFFPFGNGVVYRAIFDPSAVGEAGSLQTLDFEFPGLKQPEVPEVTAIFPSADTLPENLLRLYVEFSAPMRRGQAEANICLLGPDGQTAEDVLYRPPVELWDRRMRRLTVLLDPGRLKRHVGPNRALGPPLTMGETYTLVVGAGFVDISGSPLPAPVTKAFRISEPMRSLIDVEDWMVRAPRAATREPLWITFPRPLDEAMLKYALTITGPSGHPVLGEIKVDRGETRFAFAPNSSWIAGWHQVRIAADLEDICGNTPYAAFDRPLRLGSGLKSEKDGPSLAFRAA